MAVFLFEIIILKSSFRNILIPFTFLHFLLVIGILCTLFAFIVLFRTLFHKNDDERFLRVTYYCLTGVCLATLIVRYLYDLHNIFFVIFSSREEALHYVASLLSLPGGFAQTITFLALLLMINLAEQQVRFEKPSGAIPVKRAAAFLLLAFYIAAFLFEIIILKDDFWNLFKPFTILDFFLVIGFSCTVFAFVVLFRTLFHKNDDKHLLRIAFYCLAGAFGVVLSVGFVYDLYALFFAASPSKEDAFRYVASSLALPGSYSQTITFLALLLMIHAISVKGNQINEETVGMNPSIPRP